MVGSTLGIYIFGLIFVSARTNKRHHHHNHMPLVGSYFGPQEDLGLFTDTNGKRVEEVVQGFGLAAGFFARLDGSCSPS
jgi:hypothetical protein